MEIMGGAKLPIGKFKAYLKANGGLYSRTAEAIQQKEGITFTRQAVKQRADKYPEFLKQIQDELLDKAESNIHDIMDKDEHDHVKLKANLAYLEKKGKERGWGEESTLNVNAKLTEEKKINLEDIDADLLLEIKEQQKDNKYNPKKEDE